MTKFCPVCFGEFQQAMQTCPTDHVDLVANKPQDIERFIDIYAANDEIEAERIVAFLHDIKIASQYSKTGISQLPLPSDTAFIISVPKQSAKSAITLIKQSRDDDVISKNGIFL